MTDLGFPRSLRVRSKQDISAVFATRRAMGVGPLVVHAAQTSHGTARLGLAVPRRAGNAPTRNRIKRLLREAFRLSRSHWPDGWDFVVVVKPHAPAPLHLYGQYLHQAIEQLTRSGT